MSKGKRRVFGVAGLLAVALVAGVAMLPAPASTDAGAREVRIVARDMAFYVDGDDRPNPTLRFRAGEQIRLVLRNEDAGMDHDFAIGNWRVGTKLLEGTGEDAVTFRVPEARGSESYACTPHSGMMRGAIDIE